jgi:hypothetical protein
MTANSGFYRANNGLVEARNANDCGNIDAVQCLRYRRSRRIGKQDQGGASGERGQHSHDKRIGMVQWQWQQHAIFLTDDMQPAEPLAHCC